MNKKSIENFNERISKLWDDNVIIRANDLEDGTDYSYINVIKPFVVKEINLHTTPISTILDIGSGCGYLTNAVFEQGRHMISGIDLSTKSVTYSQKRYPHILFVLQDILSIAIQNQYDMCLTVMTLNNLPDIETFFSVAENIIKPDGKMIVVLPHPCFWPYHHLKDKSFSYLEMKSYETPFQTKGRQDYSAPMIYFHRPLEVYLNHIQKAGFRIIHCEELSDGVNGDALPDIIGMTLKKI